MLALTPDAAEAIDVIVHQSDAPDGAVVRISTAIDGPEGDDRALQLAVVNAPAADDVQVEGLPVSVEPATVEFLNDKVLDAEVHDGEVNFSLYRQAIEAPPDGIGTRSSPNGSRPAPNGGAPDTG